MAITDLDRNRTDGMPTHGWLVLAWHGTNFRRRDARACARPTRMLFPHALHVQLGLH
ncbi:hypothetical protein CLAFUW4_13714 [Fulvia fulva]|uniref:uncharacterized protein n=1 Tax=Passalora fulva TaxID=5499 RepID=UPI002852D99D|nr:uncharacterized protein CLAFUR5_20358 [Fulvia fulva]KAK4610337.1 hypothetical protein CLAFUR4_13717 [Fulvia fulva]KAK4611419.1 hypothetical protein CLAFUR0_13721 [Fulvia fulva]WMI39065.1 hypothetical protein CLAFUR5_20358 [Fulvia fulva]WPV21850.1 hypothetical protein CLAFUW4_13714 [Fulvia fulva]WPV37200.1 hypothetical protein CLAFUW7_13722 [Fulvia fulva]